MTNFAGLDDKMRALGFSSGAAASTDDSTAEVRSRVPDWRVGYVIARAYSEAIKEGNAGELATTAGRLGAQYGVDVDQLLEALSFGDAQREVVRRAFSRGK
ncbi:Protein of unknown function [Burkholderia sp. D7]|nr:Protein of unknown function [Burkholderia sp. D7]